MGGNVLVCSSGSYKMEQIVTQLRIHGCTIVETNNYVELVDKAISGEFNYIVVEQFDNQSWAVPIRKIVSTKYHNICLVLNPFTRIALAGAKTLGITYVASINDDAYKTVDLFLQVSDDTISRDKVTVDESGIIHYKDFKVDTKKGLVGYNDKWTKDSLGGTALSILECLMEKPEEILDYPYIAEKVYKADSDTDPSYFKNSMAAHVSAIRGSIREVCGDKVSVGRKNGKGYFISFITDAHVV